MALATAVACAGTGSEKASAGGDTEVGGADDDSSPHDDGHGGGDSGGNDGGGPCEEGDEGLEEGQCPSDISFVDGTEVEHLFSDYRGSPVLIIGTAEW
jgi:hypothetical protein